MKDGFRITHFCDWSRVDELRALFRTGLGETSKEFWLWKYGGKNGLEAPDYWIIEDASGEMVGTFGIQPYLYRKLDDEYIIVQLQDMVVAPQCRGFGFPRILYHTALERCKEYGAVAFVAYSNEASIGPFMKYGAVNMGDIGALHTRKKELAFLKKPKTHLEKDGWSYTLTETMPEDIFFKGSADAFKMVKSPEFMRWRFDQNPDEDFRWLTVRRDDTLQAWVVFQIFRGRIHTAVNIYDYDLRKDLPEEIRQQSLEILQTCGSWVSLWGRMSEDERTKWRRAGMTREEQPSSHFLLHFFDGSVPPENWRILRVDRDF